ncbi:hypothetical protein BJX64DRAFT_245580 [Aspergillus heterothallicus]
MPHPNQSQCSTYLRSPVSQGSDTIFSSSSEWMHGSTSSLPNATLRRTRFSRRARPGATSIADIFVQSLVVAGYCHEHSPHSRGLTTLSIKSTRRIPKTPGERGVGGNPRQFLMQTVHGSLRARARGLGAQRLKTQQMFSSSVAQRLELPDNEGFQTGQISTNEPSHKGFVDKAEPKDGEPEATESQSNVHPPLSHGDMRSDYPIEHMNSDNSDNSSFCDTGGIKTSHSHHELEKHAVEKSPKEERFTSHKSPRTELFNYTAHIFRAALGPSKDFWRSANTLVPYQERFWDDSKMPTTTPPPPPPLTPNQAEYVQKFSAALLDLRKSNHYIFKLYKHIPSPGVAHLDKPLRGTLLRRFAKPPDRRWVDARRYLAIIEDMLAARLSVSQSLWTSAVHLAGRATGEVHKSDLIRAIGIWKQMEYLGEIKSDGVVFTVLFDIAAKSGQYTVAERLLEEMESRKLEFGREGKITKIFYYGLLRDPVGISRAYDEFVESGEIVDTVVMNCLMASFLRAGKAQMAQQIYSRLLKTARNTRLPETSDQATWHVAGPNRPSELVVYRERNRKLGRVLRLSAALKDSLPQHHRALQEALLLAADTRTFHILLKHHAQRAGTLGAFMSIVDDMEKVYRVPPRGMIYLLLFEGFHRNGRSKKGWTGERLRMVWKAYLRALHESKIRLHHRAYSLPQTSIWENPLRDTDLAAKTKSPHLSPSTASSLYTHLPSIATNDADSNTDDDAHSDTSLPLQSDLHDPHLANSQTQGPLDGNDHLEFLERRIENGVFLGRHMIILILRAFGTCCKEDELMDVWLRIESIWQPEKRKGLDVMAVRKEFTRQLEKLQSRN